MTEHQPSTEISEDELALQLAAVREALNIAPDEVGRIMHESWTRTKLAQGFHRPPPPMREDPCDKCHADLIPWEELPEGQKDINRHAFDDVLAEIRRRAILAEPVQPAPHICLSNCGCIAAEDAALEAT